MSKVLIDRALLERAVYRLELAYDADAPIICDLSSVLSAPSGTPAMPVKAYYHEWTDLEGVRTRSVGLEVRKAFTDAPLVLEADALTQSACLEGEIAKRDARIVELEGALLDANARLNGPPVSEAKAQGVIDFVFSGELPNATFVEVEDGNGSSINVGEWFKRDDGYSVLRLAAAPIQQVSVPDVSAMARILADRSADACNVNREDNWAIHGHDYIDDVTAMLAADLSAGKEVA